MDAIRTGICFVGGRELEQPYNKRSIKITVSNFVSDLEPVTVPNDVTRTLDEPLGPKPHPWFHCRVGQLQWLQWQGKPFFLSYATHLRQSQSATPTGHDLLSQLIDA